MRTAGGEAHGGLWSLEVREQGDGSLTSKKLCSSEQDTECWFFYGGKEAASENPQRWAGEGSSWPRYWILIPISVPSLRSGPIIEGLFPPACQTRSSEEAHPPPLKYCLQNQ